MRDKLPDEIIQAAEKAAAATPDSAAAIAEINQNYDLSPATRVLARLAIVEQNAADPTVRRDAIIYHMARVAALAVKRRIDFDKALREYRALRANFVPKNNVRA